MSAPVRTVKWYAAMIAVVLVIIALMDWTSAKLFQWVTGESFYYFVVDPNRGLNKKYRTSHPVYHHDLLPNVDLAAKWGPLSYRIVTNNLGFADRQPRVVTAMQTGKRWLLMGDSFTEGVGYSYGETFAGQMEGLLQQQGESVEILNAGVSSYSPIIYFKKTAHLLEKGVRFDQLIVFLDISDIDDEANNYEMSQDGRVVDRSRGETVTSSLGGVKEFFRNNSLLYGLPRMVKIWRKFNQPGANLADNWVLNYPRANWTFDEGVWSTYGERGVAQGENYLTQLAQLLREHHIPLTLVVYPWPNQIAHQDMPSRQETIWRQWAERMNVQFIDLFPDFIGTDPAKNRAAILENYIPNDMHWNQAGHRRVAQGFLSRYRPQ